MDASSSFSPWATLRFRRARDVRGWALLGIPTPLYPRVMHRLFEQQARFIKKHHQGDFVSILFEAPVSLAARLALTFPAPAGAEVLSTNEAGDRILSGKFAQSSQARRQSEPTGPGLSELAEQPAFWQAVQALVDEDSGFELEMNRDGWASQHQAVQGELPVLETSEDVDDSGGVQDEDADAVADNGGWEEDESWEDDEGWEEDEPVDAVAEDSAEESFEDVWVESELESLERPSEDWLCDEGPQVDGNFGRSRQSAMASSSENAQEKVTDPLTMHEGQGGGEAVDDDNGLESDGLESDGLESDGLESDDAANGDAESLDAGDECWSEAGIEHGGKEMMLSDSEALSHGGQDDADISGETIKLESIKPQNLEQGDFTEGKSDSKSLLTPESSLHSETESSVGSAIQQIEPREQEEPTVVRLEPFPVVISAENEQAADAAVISHVVTPTAVGKVLGEMTVGQAVAHRGAASNFAPAPMLLREPQLPNCAGMVAPADVAMVPHQASGVAVSRVSARGTEDIGQDASLSWPAVESVLQGDPFQIDLLLYDGVEAWNHWRSQNPQVRPNLRGAYLNHLDLRWADLHDVDLRFAFLFYADLAEADLYGASLSGADLIHANLEAADLRCTSLCGAYLSHANLSYADLRDADLNGAFLHGADFYEAFLPVGLLPDDLHRMRQGML